MLYSDFYLKKSKEIPTLVGILAVGLTIFVVSVISRLQVTPRLPSRADQKVAARLRILNLSSNQVNVFWQSNESGTGWVVFGGQPDQLNNIALDVRDVASSRNRFLNHYTLLENLQPQTTYYFKIVTNNKLSGMGDGRAFSFKTLPEIKESSNLQPAYGKILKKNGTPIENAVVILTIADTYPLSVLAKGGGDFVIPLNHLINSQSNTLKTLSDEEVIKLEILTEDKDISNVKTNLSNISPLSQSIIIGRDYNFLDEDNVLAAASDNKKSDTKNSIGITFPRADAIISSFRPLVKGTALPNSRVNVAVGGAGGTFSEVVTTDRNGLWRFALKNNLKPGRYSLSIATKDKNGQAVSTIRNFSIAKSGEGILGEATPEATMTPGEATPTPTETLEPTTTPTSETTPTTTPEPPASGSELVQIFGSSLSFIIIGVGLMLLAL
jgi:hypothetical protein